MSDARLYLFDDDTARGFEPFARTGPVGELLFGALRQRERAERVLGLVCAGHLVGADLAGLSEPGAPGCLVPDEVDDARPRVLLNSRVVPDDHQGSADLDPSSPARLTVDGRHAGWVLPAGVPLPADPGATEAGPTDAPERALPGRWIDHVWTLMHEGPERTAADIPAYFPESRFVLTEGVHAEGTDRISLGRDVAVEPGVVLDARRGPIRLGDGVVVRAFTRIEGPFFAARGARLLGGSFAATSVGPHCRVRGEVESSTLLAWVNKAHDGFLGHAYVGRWVNLGALTTNSDLKNNYGTVRVWTPAGRTDTGLVKVGCFLGDHVKTGIGTLLPTGCVVGAGSNVFGSGLAPAYVPPFSWGGPQGLDVYDLERFLQTTERAMARRDVRLDEGTRRALARAWEASRAEREAPGA